MYVSVLLLENESTEELEKDKRVHTKSRLKRMRPSSEFNIQSNTASGITTPCSSDSSSLGEPKKKKRKLTSTTVTETRERQSRTATEIATHSRSGSSSIVESKKNKRRLTSTTVRKTRESNEVEQFLSGLGFEEYWKTFEKKQVTSIELLKYVTSYELQQVFGMKIHESLKVLLELRK